MRTVVVVGAGPVGLMLACELGLAGVRPIVLERLSQATGQSRALGLHSRTVEVLDQRGLLDRFSEGAPVWPKGHFAGMRLLELDQLDGRHTYALMVPQSRTEALLEERAVELGSDLRRGHELLGLDQDSGGVRLTVAGPAGEYELAADYVVGCDGGSSRVRKLAGIEFPGNSSTLNAVLGDVQLDQTPTGPHLSRCSGGVFGTVPLGGDRYRIVAAEFVPPTAHRDDPVTLQELIDTTRRVTGLDIEVGETYWLSRFGNATRQAANYRSGRVFLAGDAAHVHFPAGGQGLNTGVQDAVNLGWKLAAVIRGEASPSLLDTYHAERHPVAKRVCHNTQAQLALMNPSPSVDPLRDLFAELLAFREVNKFISEMITGLDVRYPMPGGGEHSLLGTRLPDWPLLVDGAEVGAMRLLHAGQGFLLDLTGGRRTPELLDAAGGRVRVVTATAAEPGRPEALLVRPDGYVAWIDGDLEAALQAWFGVPRPAMAS
ncbi:FAD-dependent monooxygenase [Kutzneria sp. NPDC052558]|uniref:FAD-dependent monooxygenase n=1 Tax=Kutzneria sp. NPDC052558 TaxID=3364121 RepID=UPI0037C5D23F